MNAEIITIGDEILIGQILDTNSAFIAKELNKIGVSVYQITSVQDDKLHILKALKEAEENAEIIILTGGLGPTKDDITKKTIAEYFNDELEQDEEVLDNIKRIWRDYIKKPLSQINIDQALIPSKSEALMNLHGSAPGMWIKRNSKVFISLPGVPFEMKSLISNTVLPRLQSQFKLPYISHKTLITQGLGESSLAERIESWEESLPSFIKLAYLPNFGRVRLRLSAKGNAKEKIDTEITNQINKLIPKIEDIFVGFEDDESSTEALIGKLLVKKGKTLSLAESCTGGKIAQSITAVSGASDYFKGSIVSYSTQTKIDILKIDKQLINKYSVVSSQVAKAMAVQVQKLFKTDYAIPTTGNAGPIKGDSDAEVGTVYIAICSPKGVSVKKFIMGNLRTKVINKAVNKAFELLYKEILKN